MIKLLETIALNLILLVTVVSFLVIGALYAIPSKWLIDYRSIAVEDACFTDNVLHVSSVRIPRVTVGGQGVDSVYLNDTNERVARWEWVGVAYRAGTSISNWDFPLSDPLPEGEYYLEGDIIYKLPPFGLPRPIEEPIRSNTFNITNCEVQIST